MTEGNYSEVFIGILFRTDYNQEFQQESVLRVAEQSCRVGKQLYRLPTICR